MTGTSMNRRRWQNFRRNRRAYVSLIVFCACFALSLFAELLANDRPILLKYRDGYYMPIFQFYSEQTFGGDLRTEAIYGDVEVQCLIVTGGLDACWDTPELLIEDARDGTIGDQPAAEGDPVHEILLILSMCGEQFDTLLRHARLVPASDRKKHG